MLIRLDTTSGLPLYQQIVDQIKHMIAAGTIQLGDKLPTVREMASRLVINPNTVAHAYQQLERERVIETKRGLGSFACGTGSDLHDHARRQLVADLLDRALVQAHHVNIPPSEVRALLEERLSALFPPSTEALDSAGNGPRPVSK